jgi:L-ascorbate metabolism protein UlaG (beta-lactamase superfamily)
MKTRMIILLITCFIGTMKLFGISQPDTIQTSEGNLVVHFIGHGSLFFEFNHKILHVDPFSRLTDYSTLPKADLILITHGHPDHFDSLAIFTICKKTTMLIYTQACANTHLYNGDQKIMQNGDQLDIMGIHIEAVPAYNLTAKRPDGLPFHPKGEGNGYVLTIGGKRIYIAGDTENIPEMKSLGPIDIAFLPMNLPYTMTPEQMADAARMVHPQILYPYHFGNTDVSILVNLLKDEKSLEIRLRDMK